MTRARKAGILGSILGAAAALTATIALVSLAGQAPEAQAQSTSNPRAPRFIYSAKYVNQVVPTDTRDHIVRVYAFPDSPCFLVRTEKAIRVFTNNNGIFPLIEVPLDERFQDLIFLDDGRTFIVVTRNTAKIYVVNRDLVTEK